MAVLPTGIPTGSPGALVGPKTTYTLVQNATFLIPAGSFIVGLTGADMDLEMFDGTAWIKIRDGTQADYFMVRSDGANFRFRNGGGGPTETVDVFPLG